MNGTALTFKSLRGLWFYGLSGSGKSYASSLVCAQFPNAFLIDGDDVRRHVSTDLGYTHKERLIQINRLLGIGLIALKNNYFPIISSVTMTEELLSQCKSHSIHVLRIERKINQLETVRNLYKNQKNVVGVDIPLATLDTNSIENDGTENFIAELKKYVKSISD